MLANRLTFVGTAASVHVSVAAVLFHHKGSENGALSVKYQTFSLRSLQDLVEAFGGLIRTFLHRAT